MEQLGLGAFLIVLAVFFAYLDLRVNSAGLSKILSLGMVVGYLSGCAVINVLLFDNLKDGIVYIVYALL